MAKVAAPSWYIRQNDGVKDDNFSRSMERGWAVCFGRCWRCALGPTSGGWINMSHISRCVFISDRQVFVCQMIAQRSVAS